MKATLDLEDLKQFENIDPTSLEKVVLALIVKISRCPNLINVYWPNLQNYSALVQHFKKL